MHYIASIILEQPGETLSSETDPLKTQSFLLSSFIHSYHGEQYVNECVKTIGWRTHLVFL